MFSFLKKLFIMTALFCLSTGCTVAVPEVTSFLSNFSSFKLTNNQYRIDSLSDLSTLSLSANCDASNTGLEFELTDIAPGVWNAVPTTTPSGFFISVTNLCTTSGNVSMTLDLSATAPFSTMTLGSTYKLSFRDTNLLGISQTEIMSITYSMTNLTQNRLINGQGLNNTKTGTSHTLQGRVINVPQLPTTTGTTHTLQGQTFFE